jgi:hypothetical protein
MKKEHRHRAFSFRIELLRHNFEIKPKWNRRLWSCWGFCKEFFCFSFKTSLHHLGRLAVSMAWAYMVLDRNAGFSPQLEFAAKNQCFLCFVRVITLDSRHYGWMCKFLKLTFCNQLDVYIVLWVWRQLGGKIYIPLIWTYCNSPHLCTVRWTFSLGFRRLSLVRAESVVFCPALGCCNSRAPPAEN